MEVLISAERIAARIDEIATEVSKMYKGKDVTVVGVLTGSLVFLADLVRRVDLPLQIGLLKATSYQGTQSTGVVKIDDSCLPNLAGRHVLLLDDILDTGRTISVVADYLIKERGAESVRTCVLLRKIGRQVVPFEPDLAGFEIPDRFVIGYGLDYNDEYRHLPFIGVLSESAIHA
ncbi:MAG: hypoxanthine phosphoribosyltransferase [Gemmataceae bacterium]